LLGGAQGVFALSITIIPVTRPRVAKVRAFLASDLVGLIMI
jgi:hypothetical protein